MVKTLVGFLKNMGVLTFCDGALFTVGLFAVCETSLAFSGSAPSISHVTSVTESRQPAHYLAT